MHTYRINPYMNACIHIQKCVHIHTRYITLMCRFAAEMAVAMMKTLGGEGDFLTDDDDDDDDDDE